MTKVLFVAPLEGNGGIVTWAANYRKVMIPDIVLISIGVSKRRALRKVANLFNIIFDGLRDLKSVLKDIDCAIKENEDVKIMHMTTSGGNGTLRDFFIARKAQRNGLKCIMHCHYGCIPQDFEKRGIRGALFHKTLRLFDQIWVLDRKSFQALDKDPNLHGKIELVPNFLEVPTSTSYTDKDFFACLDGMELTWTNAEAFSQLFYDEIAELYIPYRKDVINQEELCVRIDVFVNEHQLELSQILSGIRLDEGCFVREVSEAFPISILEAMSLSKLVISCDRAAIPDMLTDMNGNMCGILVAPKSSSEIEKAIKWCQKNKTEANKMCRQAYNKVYSAYRTDIVIKMCVDNYRKLL